MSNWSWTYEDADGAAVTPPSGALRPFPSQAEAEAWVGETWQALLADGVEGVTLHRDGDVVYGPMSLRPTS